MSGEIFSTLTGRAPQLDLSGAKKVDCCLDSLSKSAPLCRALSGLLKNSKRKELRLRVVTCITSRNLGACKQLRHFDLYHSDGAVGNFCIIDGAAYLYAGQAAGMKKSAWAYSTYAPFVKMQEYLFENLLARSTPAKDRFKEIERGVETEYIKTVRDPLRALQLARDLANSASFEICVLFSTVNSFYRAEEDGLLDLLGLASNRGIDVRVLVKVDDEKMKDAARQKIKQKYGRINAIFIRQALKSKVTMLVVDQAFTLAIEVNDDAGRSFQKATGLATYSNSESMVFTCYSMFENLWMQAELERQSSVKQAYFRMFREQKLRDEIYRRDWTLKDLQ